MADRLDYGRMIEVGRSYLLDDWRRRELDVLVRLPFAQPDGRELLVCVLVEHQSTADQAMPLRLLVYAVLYWEQEWKAWEDDHERGRPLRLTPVLPVVLHTGQEPWDSSRSLADLFDVPAELQAWLPRWTMPLWDLPEHPVEELLAQPDGWWQFLGVVRSDRAPTDEFMRTLLDAMRHLEPLGPQRPQYWQQLLNLILGWALYRRSTGERVAVLDVIRQAHTDLNQREEAIAMNQQLGKTWAEEFFEKGLAQGEARGEARGETEAYRTMLRSLLERRFGVLPEELIQRLTAADLSKLKAVMDRVLDFGSLEEISL